MELEDIRNHLQKFNDADIMALLTAVSDEVKRRNTILNGILGNAPPEVRRETIKQSMKVILEAIQNDSKK